MTCYLRATALSCERDARLLFEHLSFELQAGELLWVRGPNGAGKTSLLRVLAGLAPASAGAVTRAVPVLWLGHAAGLNGALSAEENLAWLAALHGADARDGWRQALAAVGLRGYEDVPCHSLSAGQQRRVGLARLYLPGPALWVLDEPFTALDAAGVAQLEARLAAHCGEGGAVVLTSHHPLAQRPPAFRELALGAAA